MNLEPLKNKIIEAVPEIMELKFGCEFEWQDEKGDTAIYQTIYVAGIESIDGRTSASIYAQKKNEQPKGVLSWETDDEDFPFLEYAKILGRPIRLADVLETMRRSTNCLEHHRAELVGIGNTGGIEHRWSLLDDDLEKQSPETIKFLEKLLLN